jgi:hypothetical protein
VAAGVDGSGGGGMGVDGSCGSSGAAVMFGGGGGARWHVWRLSRKLSSDYARGRRHSGRGGSDGDAAREAAGTTVARGRRWLGDGDGDVGALDLAGRNNQRRSSSPSGVGGFLLNVGKKEVGQHPYIPPTF